MIRRTFPVICLLDGAVRVAIEQWPDEPQIWLHTDTARVRLSTGDANVAAVMLQAAVAEVLGEVGEAPAHDDEAVAKRVAVKLAADATVRIQKADPKQAAVEPDKYLSWARDMVAMVREASA